MAQRLTLDEIVTMVFGAIADYHTGPDEIFPITGVQLKLHPEVDAEEFGQALQYMAEKGWIAAARAGHAFLTQAGFEEM
jgi:hypothetical protein